MSQNIKGTFPSIPFASPSPISDVLVIPSGIATARLSLIGELDGSTSVTSQKSLDSGQHWVDQVTYTEQQVNTAVSVAHGEQWRLIGVGLLSKPVDYSFSVESPG